MLCGGNIKGAEPYAADSQLKVIGCCDIMVPYISQNVFVNV
jgi:hypothetical protein